MEVCSGSPRGKTCSNEELICVDKMPWRLCDLCSYTFDAKWKNHLLYKLAVNQTLSDI